MILDSFKLDGKVVLATGARQGLGQGIVLAYLASSASDYMHGVILPVDGGWLAR